MANFTWGGDFTEANNWRPFAEAMLVTLKQVANGKLMQQRCQPSQDISIMVQCNPDTIYIDADVGSYVYLDSGIVDATFAPGNIKSYQPGRLYRSYASKVDATLPFPLNGVLGIKSSISGIDSKSKRYLGRKHLEYAATENQVSSVKSSGVDEGESSCSFGSPYEKRIDHSLTPELTPVLESTSTAFKGGEHDFNAQSYMAKVVAASFIPASLFTGMAKVYVQALYGSERRQISMEVSDNNIIGIRLPVKKDSKAEKAGVVVSMLPYTRAYNLLFLPVGNSYQVVLMEFTRTDYRVYRLEANRSADKLLRNIDAIADELVDPSRMLKLKTAVLATCEVSEALTDWIPIDNAPDWEFSAYSWKFDKKGTTGVGVAYQTNYADTPYKIAFKKTVLDIKASMVKSSTGEFELFSSVRASTGIVSYIHTTPTPLFVPAAPHAKHMKWLGEASNSNITTSFITNGPLSAVVYSYFDDEDTLVDVTVSQDISWVSASINIDVRNSYYSGESSGISYENETIYNNAGLNGAITVSISDHAHTARLYDRESRTLNIHKGWGQPPNHPYAINPSAGYIEMAGLYWVNPPGIVSNSPTYYGGMPSYSQTAGFIFRRFENHSFGAEFSNEAMAVVIPEYDASSVLLVKYENYHSPDSSGNASETTGGVAGATGVGEPATILFTGGGDQRYVAATWGGNLGGYSSSGATFETIVGATKDSSSVYLFGGKDKNELLDEVVGQPQIVSNLIHPWAQSSEAPEMLTNRQTLHGAWRSLYRIGDQLKHKEFPYDISVGWE